MKKLILSGLITLCLTGCAVKSPSDNNIRRGMETHNFLVINSKCDEIIKNQEKILENQKQILEKLEDR